MSYDYDHDGDIDMKDIIHDMDMEEIENSKNYSGYNSGGNDPVSSALKVGAIGGTIIAGWILSFFDTDTSETSFWMGIFATILLGLCTFVVGAIYILIRSGNKKNNKKKK